MGLQLPEAPVVQAATGIIAAVITLISALIVVSKQNRQALEIATKQYRQALEEIREDLRASYERELRTKRIEVYARLFETLSPVNFALSFKEVDARKLSQLAVDLRDWYYQEGGLFLSGTTKDKRKLRGRKSCITDEPIDPDHDYIEGSIVDFMDLYKDLQQVDPQAVISETVFNCFRDKASTLRTALTVDIGTRRVLIPADLGLGKDD